MSDAKTAAEIEDILSSIRRLVAQDRKPAARPVEGGAPQATVVPGPQVVSRLVVEDRLLLTPAQRVAPRPSATVTPLKRSTDRAGGGDAQPVDLAIPAKTAARPAGKAGAETAQSAGPVEEAGRAPVQSAGPLPATPPSAKHPLGRLHLEAEAPLVSETPGLGPRTVAESPDLAPSGTSLAWEAELGDPAPELGSLDWSSFTFARRPMAETYAARNRAAERLAPHPEAPAPIAQAPIAQAPIAQAPIAQAPVDLAPAGKPQPAFPEDPAATETPVDLGAAPVEPALAETPILQEEDSIFSEEVLRELVRDLIREQLQGELGERITRNIRKLIKAEIARNLTVQQLD